MSAQTDPVSCVLFMLSVHLFDPHVCQLHNDKQVSDCSSILRMFGAATHTDPKRDTAIQRHATAKTGPHTGSCPGLYKPDPRGKHMFVDEQWNNMFEQWHTDFDEQGNN